MKKLLFLILFAYCPLMAEGPVYQYKDPTLNQELQNSYQDIRNKANRSLDNLYNVSITTRVTIDNGIFIDLVNEFPSDRDTYIGIMRTGPSGSDPFNQAGSMILRTRVSSTAGRSSLYVYTGSPTTLRFKIDETGNITQPTQPSFLVEIAGATNVTGDGTSYTVAWDTEIYDQGSNFSGTTFTAPVTGKYFLSVSILTTGNLATHTGNQLSIVTSNRSYFENSSDAQAGNRTRCLTVIADMDAADTATVAVVVSGDTKVVDLSADARFNIFSGTLSN